MARQVPYDFTPGEIADANEVTSNFSTIETWFGDIRDADVADDADLNCGKLSTTPGKRMVASRMENNAVTDRVLASDASAPGSDALRAVSGDHVKALTAAALLRILPANGIVASMLAAGVALANLVAASIGLDKLKYTVHTVAFAFAATPSGSAAVNPTATFTKAAYELVGWGVKNVSVTAGSLPTAIAMIADDAGPNWAGTVRAMKTDAGNVSGTAVYVFGSRT